MYLFLKESVHLLRKCACGQSAVRPPLLNHSQRNARALHGPFLFATSISPSMKVAEDCKRRSLYKKILVKKVLLQESRWSLWKKILVKRYWWRRSFYKMACKSVRVLVKNLPSTEITEECELHVRCWNYFSSLFSAFPLFFLKVLPNPVGSLERRSLWRRFL